jgi:hypothetical protein
MDERDLMLLVEDSPPLPVPSSHPLGDPLPISLPISVPISEPIPEPDAPEQAH